MDLEEEDHKQIFWPTECKVSTEGDRAETKITIESANVTNMGYNARAVIEREAEAIFFQEHKLKGKAIQEMKQKLKKAGWTMLCGPCDETTKKANAGVGVMTKDGKNLVAVQAGHNTTAFQNVWLAGRAGKYEIDMGWEANLTCYVIYGKSGGATKDKAVTDAILQAIKEEIDSEIHRPTIILGDFNAEPDTLKTAKKWIEDEQWIDVGKNASWWKGQDSTPTCQTRPQAKPTRIDGALANRAAIPWIRGFEVVKDEMLPTHAVVRITLGRNASKETRTYAKTLPSIRKFFEKKADEVTKDLNGKEKREGKKREVKNLHELMDANFRKARTQMQIYKAAKNTTGYWKAWSQSVENAFLHYIDESKVFNRKMKGRGEATLIQVKPDVAKKDKKKDTTRGTESTEAEKSIKQARRCEQFAFRLGLIAEEKRDQNKRLSYYQLNKDAAKGIAKHVGENAWEQELRSKVLNPGMIAADPMIAPLMKRCATKYHEEGGGNAQEKSGSSDQEGKPADIQRQSGRAMGDLQRSRGQTC